MYSPVDKLVQHFFSFLNPTPHLPLFFSVFIFPDLILLSSNLRIQNPKCDDLAQQNEPQAKVKEIKCVFPPTSPIQIPHLWISPSTDGVLIVQFEDSKMIDSQRHNSV